MATSGTVVLILIGLLVGSGIGYSYANSIFSPIELSLRDEVNQLEVLLDESGTRIDALEIELGQANSNTESEKGIVSALSLELERTNGIIRSLERDIIADDAALELERQMVASTQLALTIAEEIVTETAQSYSQPSEALTKYFDARESARNVNFSAATVELGEARKRFVLLENTLTARIDQLNRLSEISPRDELISAANYSTAFALGIQATISRVDALLLLYTVLEEFEALEFRAEIADLDRWKNLLDQSEFLIGRGELFVEQAFAYSPTLEYLELELVSLRDVLNEIITFREFFDL